MVFGAASSRCALAAARASRWRSKRCIKKAQLNGGQYAARQIHVVEGRYDEARITKISGAIQAALMNTLRVPAEDFYQLIFELPKSRFLHTPSFVGMHYNRRSDHSRSYFHPRAVKGNVACPFERHQHTRCRGGCRLAGRHIDFAVRVAGENISFGQGEAQRAKAVTPASACQPFKTLSSGR